MKHMVPIVAVLAGCSNELEQTCRDLCSELVGACDFAAFPSLDSCVQGCRYNAEELGADVVGQLACIQQAACVEPAIIECEHEYGVD